MRANIHDGPHGIHFSERDRVSDHHLDFVDYDELPTLGAAGTRCSWGVFGTDDEVGTLNWITAQSVANAAALVTRGQVFPLNWDVDLPAPAILGRENSVHTRIPGEIDRDDFYNNYFPQSSSQWDSLAHVLHPEFGFYNRHPAADVDGPRAALGIQNWARRGIAGRFVLADVARARGDRGTPLDLSARTPVRTREIEQVLRQQGTELHGGDILLVHFGWTTYYETLSVEQKTRLTDDLQFDAPGLEASTETARWLWNHRIAAVAGDNPALEAMPFDAGDVDAFLHYHLISMLGMAMGEMFKLDDLAKACAADGTYEGMLIAAPINKTGGTGSPANSVALR